jgi:hypothetical protein
MPGRMFVEDRDRLPPAKKCPRCGRVDMTRPTFTVVRRNKDHRVTVRATFCRACWSPQELEFAEPLDRAVTP